MTAPLAGVRVLDFSRLLPGPVCTLHLADLGADVIKVEDTGAGDYARSLGLAPTGDGRAPSGAPSAFFRMVNRNKRSLALDLKSPFGRDAFLRLARHADVIVESFRPGVVDRLGVGYAAVAALNPRIVYCSITGYGQTGPYRDRPGHDINYLGYAGVLDQTGTAGEPPGLSNLQVADLLGGAMNASTGILAALLGASRTGTGAHVDVAMTEGSLAHNIFALHAVETFGHARPRGDDLLTGGVPCYGVYATQDDRYLAVGALEEKFWRALCEALDRPDLVAGQLSTGHAGAVVRQELAAIFAQQTQAHWIGRLAGIDCCVTPVLSLDEALADPQVLARDMIVSGADGIRQYAPPFRMSGHAFAIARPAPAQGEHSAEILREAGFGDAEIAALSADGTIAGNVSAV
ncbi:MAG TPA: CaiB/BaiF CoA-transferase family protein [Casimicrobiaceae bacterium]|nr:CaiB/BaiF CoA-transferase family protein [Casimicrobiaceae bacterium]